MNQPTIKTAFKLIVAVIITFSLSLVLQSILAADNWQNPTCTPPGCNVPAPVNVGSSTALTHGQQVMYDGLGISNNIVIATSSGLGVTGIFTVNSAVGALYVKNNFPYYNVGISATTSLDAKLTIDMGAAGLLEGLHIRRKSNSASSWSYLNIENENGSAGPIFKVDQYGNVGVGVTNPGDKLTVVGNLGISNNAFIDGHLNIGAVPHNDSGVSIYAWNSQAAYAILQGSGDGSNYAALTLSADAAATNKAWQLRHVVTSNRFSVGYASTGNNWIDYLTIKSDGNVGIGTTSPAYKLDVNGSVNASSYYLNGAPFTGGSGYTGTINIHQLNICATHSMQITNGLITSYTLILDANQSPCGA